MFSDAPVRVSVRFGPIFLCMGNPVLWRFIFPCKSVERLIFLYRIEHGRLYKWTKNESVVSCCRRSNIGLKDSAQPNIVSFENANN